MKGKHVVEAAEAGDPHALDLFERFGRQLGVGIASLVNAFEPEHVVIGGGLGRSGRLLPGTGRARGLDPRAPGVVGADPGIAGGEGRGRRRVRRGAARLAGAWPEP